MVVWGRKFEVARRRHEAKGISVGWRDRGGSGVACVAWFRKQPGVSGLGRTAESGSAAEIPGVGYGDAGENRDSDEPAGHGDRDGGFGTSLAPDCAGHSRPVGPATQWIRPWIALL